MLVLAARAACGRGGSCETSPAATGAPKAGAAADNAVRRRAQLLGIHELSTELAAMPGI